MAQNSSLGMMIVARQPCGKVAAMAWDDPDYSKQYIKALCDSVVDWRSRGLEVVRVERFVGDAAPDWACIPCTRCHAALAAAPQLAEFAWSHAAEQLPVEEDEEASDDVLVLLADDTMDVAYYDYAARIWCDRCGFPLSEGVTHWRSLPELPQPDQEVA